MSTETYLDPEQKTSHIEAIVLAHPEVAGLQAYEYFRSAAAKQKEAFISGTQNTLDLTYPGLTLENIIQVKEPMLSALKSLMPGEVSEKSESLFRAIEYRYTELFMLDMARVMISDASDEEKALAQESFMRANEALYGAPDKNVFSALAKTKIEKQTMSGNDDSELTRLLRNELGSMVGPISETDFVPFKPETDLVTRIGALVYERFDTLVEHVDPEKEYNVAEIAQVLDTGLEKMGGKELGWRVIVIPDSSAIAVSAHQKLVEVGEGRKPIQGADLQTKVIHKLGVHAGRSINAEQAGWLSAAYGQDGYLDFEEAFATALEDAFNGQFKPHGEQYYLVAGLAYGLDNHSPRDLRETFEVLWRVKALEKVKDGQVSDNTIGEAKAAAFNNCLRLFKGTTGQQSGVVYLKDLAYFKGQESVWAVLQTVKNQRDFDTLFAGKLDNTQPDHQSIANQIVSSSRLDF